MTNKSTDIAVNHVGASVAAPHVALIAVQIMFGTWPIVGKIVLHSLPSMGLVSLRIAGAALAFVLIGRMTGGVGRIRRQDWWLLALSSVLGVVLNQLLFVKGLSITTAINSTLLGTTIPVFTLLVSVALRTDRASLRRVIGIALSAS
ncbi:MAG TPA: DMT family transporter, partial [Pyrinomonadaceae bacterium]|nr:DMT family transporter [Pyrinomonadaceae bacterium]